MHNRYQRHQPRNVTLLTRNLEENKCQIDRAFNNNTENIEHTSHISCKSKYKSCNKNHIYIYLNS